MLSYLITMLKARRGQGMVEYGLIIALIAIALIAGIGLMTGQLQAVFDKITDALEAAAS